MNIEQRDVTVRELATAYQDDAEDGVRGYDGRLDIRPPYQREFIYKDKQRDAVITTVTKERPLNVMYWAVREDGTFEIIDGQQRTISICQYIAGDFLFENRYFHNLQLEEQTQILDYKLMVYLCSGTDTEKLDWFKTINIAGERLTDQELLNAVYSGPWVTDAKKHFSKRECPAYKMGGDYMMGSAIRQDYLETAIKWINKGDIPGYMAKQQHKTHANELWLYFNSVIEWVKKTFPKYRKEMKSVHWGELYNEFKTAELDPAELEGQVAKLMEDDDVTHKRGVYYYVLDGKDEHLNIRAFSPNQRREAYERQEGICPSCDEHFELNMMEADHIIQWSDGGKTTAENCQLLCKPCHYKK